MMRVGILFVTGIRSLDTYNKFQDMKTKLIM